MKSSKRNLTNDHPKTFSKRDDKKSVSINWNSRLYFQVGLIVSLLTVFLVMESTFGLTVHRDTATGDTFEWKEADNPNYKVEEPKVIPVKKKVEKKIVSKRKKIAKVLTVVPNESITDIESKVNDTEIDINKPIIDNTPTTVVKKNVTINLLGVEFAPVFPGCESLSTNKEKIDCMSSKINSFIRKKFRTDNLVNLDSGKKHSIYVQFKIDDKGDVVDVKAQANHPSLKKEATRVISKLPKMKPGKQGDTNVNVIYGIPITFNLED